ncbi:RtcB family protein [Methylovulum psychrotolerans]|uniref:3'-phosphate/5'-hydroxy nucleic acid ligase n=1 Tax=Methylovulum psychrotolerans TaxID=1704499 RepID=A0A2S5CHH0_9GAMM|nr:RtcB family protein [Methylovulum psychrotolerans]POZ50244.1 RtcB family protein [Methylovulum psychrotolerans]
MPIQTVMTKGKVPVKIYTDEVESAAFQQLYNLSQLPFIHSHIAVMPDVHCGKGATVGSVIPTAGAIIPAAVGVDIGCGMNALRLSIKAHDLPDNLRSLRLFIEAAIPVGFAMHKQDRARQSTVTALAVGLHSILGKHRKLNTMQKKPYQTWVRQLGTLGGGNHFIELCLDENDDVWVLLHSGSRGIGNVMGEYFIALAKKDMGQHLINLPDKDLAYFSEGAAHYDDYLEAVGWAQDYALANRREMMYLICEALRKKLPKFGITKEAINCHHNYVVREEHFGKSVWITRKGAIRAGEGELGIIPGSMGAKSYIVRGKGNPQSFCSCSHGAGRVMSRSAAKKRFDSDDVDAQTRGIECRKDSGVVDEIPAAYKDIDQVMAHQSDLVEIVHTLRQVLCIKG